MARKGGRARFIFTACAEGCEDLKGGGGDLVWRGLAAPLFKGNAQGQQRWSPCSPRSWQLEVFGGPCVTRLGQMHPPMGQTLYPRSFTLHGLPSSQRKSWDEEDQPLGASRGLPSPAPTLLHKGPAQGQWMRGVRPPPHTTAPTHPQGFLPDYLGKDQPGKEHIPKTRLFFWPQTAL